MWVVLLILILMVLSVMFGGFQKGAKASAPYPAPAPAPAITSASIASRPGPAAMIV